MTSDAELRDAALAELKQTGVGYAYFTKKGTVPNPKTRWGKALAYLEQIGKPPPPPPPPADPKALIEQAVGSPCCNCGSVKRPCTTCSWCGGHGMVTGYGGDPTECRPCGYSGAQWPPTCPDCSKFRSMEGWR
jgi:hypothetical protein